MAAPIVERVVTMPSTDQTLGPNTPVFPRGALYQPNSRKISRRTSLEMDNTESALPTSPTAPSALPAVPATPGLGRSITVRRPNDPKDPSQAPPQPPQQHDFAADGADGADGGDASPEWSPAHPCFPHTNPHVPLSSPLYDTTRVIRIPRDWMAAGDLYPAFSTTYPEILAPWISEASFRALVEQINSALRLAYEPATGRAVAEGLLGLLSGWLLEDAGVMGPKKRAQYVEAIIDSWNAAYLRDVRAAMERFHGAGLAEGSDLVAIVPLRRTAYMSLDIQIPDPKIRVVGDDDNGDGDSQTNEHEHGNGAGSHGDDDYEDDLEAEKI